MRKIVLALTLIVASTATTLSQTAKSILDKTAATVSNASGISAHYKMTGGMGSANGTIAVKGRKFHATSALADIWFDGKTMWTYMKKNEEVNVSSPNEAQLQKINPYNFINLYKKGYDMTMSKAAETYTVHLTAQNGQKIKELFVTIDSKSYHPKQVKMLQGNKWTTFDISNLKAESLTDGTFTFNAKDFPQAEIIDLR